MFRRLSRGLWLVCPSWGPFLRKEKTLPTRLLGFAWSIKPNSDVDFFENSWLNVALEFGSKVRPATGFKETNIYKIRVLYMTDHWFKKTRPIWKRPIYSLAYIIHLWKRPIHTLLSVPLWVASEAAWQSAGMHFRVGRLFTCIGRFYKSLYMYCIYLHIYCAVNIYICAHM